MTHIWFWTITGPYCGEVGISTSGDLRNAWRGTIGLSRGVRQVACLGDSSDFRSSWHE